jgi:hypothetical protein
MKRNLLQTFFLNCILLLAVSNSYSQNLTGIWRGYFITEGGDQYKFELQVEQKHNAISGVSYSYLTTVFYGKATLTGNFSRSAKNALVQEIKTVEVRMGPGSVACIMKCNFHYDRSGKEEFLEGTFTSRFENDGYGAKRGDNCGGGKVYLRKVQTSDFYVEPFLRKKITSGSTAKKNSVVTPKNPPVAKKTLPEKNSTHLTPKNETVKKTIPQKNTGTVSTHSSATKKNPLEKPATDSVKKIEEPLVKLPEQKQHLIQKQDIPTPSVLKTRENSLVQTITVHTPEVLLKIYDNGVIDGDTVSVYMDKKLVLSHGGLSDKPLIVKIRLDEDNPFHEVVMVAENLGLIPPNTSLMIVEAGDKRYDVRITSTEQKNAVVRFIYQKP